MKSRELAVVVGCLATVLLGWQGALEAATYRLQVASIPDHVFMHFVEGPTLPRAEAFFDDARRSRFVLFRDRRPHLLESVGAVPLNVTPPKADNPWGVTTWEAEAGQLAVFRIRGIQSDHQKLKRVAVRRNGVLTRFPIRTIPISQSRPMQVPATAAGYLTHVLETGTFAAWVERRAVSHEGLSVIVGRRHNAQESDTVYLVVRTPQAAQGYKVVLGWKTVERKGGHAISQGKRN